MANIFDVAKYILEKYNSLTPMKLEKLCYYSQAWALVWDEKPLFDEDFHAWAVSPVCPALFRLHRGKFTMSSNDIPESFCVGGLTATDIETIDSVLSFYGDKEEHWLSELTRLERPWKEARQNARIVSSNVCNAVIEKETMQDYYAGL